MIYFDTNRNEEKIDLVTSPVVNDVKESSGELMPPPTVAMSPAAATTTTNNHFNNSVHLSPIMEMSREYRYLLILCVHVFWF